ncbi:galactose-1-phosphate uridylyltransferase [candidate division KSB1 bacterium]|nr:galactose-1-phosphate uridylyltransferase [candidate division KSB1 bacterium]NIR68498.1 galactose-1-phosphate uridylyltransferase [candidate division KSB1 bacterium]NIS22512.1 galactose-1-phosphate uridylyltransferase [candidate division KSB1 bacterium]NIT69356.1 galactose-1-phosphate uridylyltransferase [candidate division KSB1 bacterium]NIU23017.1 galactose-1-phosphate uridylyltransferase [candidate division KSB1 bacterium]
MKEHEIRQNKATREWVIYAPTRGRRPSDFRQTDKGREERPERDEHCPFCPGNKNMLPGIIMAMPSTGEEAWQTRVVPNKFPALATDGDTERVERGIYLTMPGYGRHEVIVESKWHNRGIAQMSNAEVEIIIETYHKRYVDLMKEHENMLTLLFRNHGVRAGTSLVHPHSQLIVTGFVPNHVRWREEQAQRYYDEWGRCVFCEILQFEQREQRRVVFENPSFLAFVPFAAEVPFEIWMMPKEHDADFGDINDVEKRDLAQAFSNVLTKLFEKLNDPDYNYIINTAARYKADEPQLHWYVQIRPRLTTRAGFEIGSGISINPSIPEHDAEFLTEDS